MPAEKIINHPVIGEYKIVKKTRSHGIRLSVHAAKGVKITIPTYASFSQASEFLESKLDWVSKSLAKQREKAEKLALPLVDGTSITLINGIITLSKIDAIQTTLSKHENPKITITTSRLAHNKGKLRSISYPANVSTKPLVAAITLALKRYATEYLPERIQYLATKNGFKYNKLFLKNNKSNWGSCSSLNNINLNIHLMRLPGELCDYVILHELVHLKYRNHGKEFHAYLNSICEGQEKKLSKELRQFRPNIQLTTPTPS